MLTRRSADGVRIRVSAHVRTRASGWRATTLGAYAFSPTAQTSHVTSRLRALPLITSDGRIRVVWPSLAGGHVRAAVTSLRATRAATRSWFDLSGGAGSPSLAAAAATGPVRVTAQPAGERALLGSRVAFDPTSGRPSVLWAEGGSPQGHRPMIWTSGRPLLGGPNGGVRRSPSPDGG